MSDRATAPGAVFLSYASQDAELAWRICEALRAAQVEVWFDQSELRGGDAWDANIRKRIKECTLFVPVISANTNARAEGYFRLEWHLAEQRTYLMAHDQPFLLPVIADNTLETATRVPERFRERQWMRLSDAESLATFASRVRKLLEESVATGKPLVTPPYGGFGSQPSHPRTEAPPEKVKEQRRLAAIAFTDVVGYSKRMQQDEPGTLVLVRADFALMRELCGQHGGEVLKSTGDGLLLCFASVIEAVSFALKAQAKFAYREPSSLQHRIGIHLGDIYHEGGDVAGDGVNIAARLQTKARPGTVCLSKSVYDAVKGKVPMQAESLGPQQFKNIAEPITIYLAQSGNDRPLSPAVPRKIPRFVLAAVLLIGVGLAIAFWPQPRHTGPAGTVSSNSVAVLPFTNMTDDKDTGYFADGIQDDILTALAPTHGLKVVSRTSVMRFRDTKLSMHEIGEALNTTFILEGSVRTSGSKVRVTVQLIDSRTDEHVWAKSFDRDISDIFAAQSEVSKQIALELIANVSPFLTRPAAGTPP